MPSRRSWAVRRIRHIGASLATTMIGIGSFVPSNDFRIFLLRVFGAKIGKGVSVQHGLHVRSPWRIRIADDVYIADGVVLDGRGGLRIGVSTSINTGAQLWTAQHDIRSQDFAYVARPVSIGHHAWVASRVVVLPGADIGDGAVVGAGSTLARSASPWGVYVGVPATRVADRPLVDQYRLGARAAKPWWW